jgi:hypothetical protein
VQPRLAIPRAPFLALLLAALHAGCGDLPEPRTCSGGATCSPGSWCRSGQCVANAAPQAVVEVPASIGASRPVVFRGGGSHDADPGDTVTAWAWRASPPAGASGCEPLPASGWGADFTVVFPCPGDHDVVLSVTDSLGLGSAERVVRVHVEATTDAPLVSVGPDLAVDHACTGAPLTCTARDGLSSEVALFAAGSAAPGVTFTYRWTVELPPELASQPPPRVTFAPGDAVASPRVRIETDGTAIAGRYTFVVAATDSRGMVAIGRQRVDVGNRPPVVSGGGTLALPHAYEPATRSFVASGDTPAATWTDPDGDPVETVGFATIRSGDGGAVFEAKSLGDRAHVTVVVPFASPGDAAFLLGPDVRRRVELIVADVNGARGGAGWDVTVSNRAPRLSSIVATASVDHGFDAGTRRYVAQAALSTWVDDDGDPIELSASGDPLCATVENRQGTAWITCSAPYPGRPAASAIVGTRSIRASARDPFGAGPAQTTTLEIRNRPPRLLASAVALPTTCSRTSVCCEIDPNGHACTGFGMGYAPVSVAVPLLVDDDGDPLDLAATSSGDCLAAGAAPAACPAEGCAIGLSLCGDLVCGGTRPGGWLALAASDGLGSVSAELPVDAACR